GPRLACPTFLGVDDRPAASDTGDGRLSKAYTARRTRLCRSLARRVHQSGRELRRPASPRGGPEHALEPVSGMSWFEPPIVRKRIRAARGTAVRLRRGVFR